MPSELLSREPVVAKDAFWGRSDDIKWVTGKLGGQMPQNCNIIGEPRIGKTSLLYHVYQQKIGLPEGMAGLYVWVRLVELPAHGPREFWRLMLMQLNVALGRLEPEVSPSLPENERDLFDKLDMEIDRILFETGINRLIFLIDDFDLLVGSVTKHDLDWLRALASRYRESLAFVISSSEPLVKLCDEIAAESGVSPFPNLFHSYWLGLLDLKGAQDICKQASDLSGLALMPESVAFLLREAGRHPDLLKMACEYFLAISGEPLAMHIYEATRTVIRLDEHVNWLCRRLWLRCSPEEQVALSALAAGRKNLPNPAVTTQLTRRRSLVEGTPDDFHLFAEVFKVWIMQETAVSAPEVPVFDHQAEQRLVRVEGREVPLTALENRLFAYLLNHTNQVCTTDDLLANVWGAGKQKSVVEKGMNRLRSKIEAEPKRPRYILAARGEGYILRTTTI